MRAILAGIIVVAGVGFVALAVVERVPMWIGVPLIVGTGGVLCIVVLVLFNSFDGTFRNAPRWEEVVAEWAREGLLETQSFQVKRAFGVQAGEGVDEDIPDGLLFFLELDDGAVLFLGGTYLDDYALDQEESEAPPRFPCTAFSLRRPRETGAAVDLECRGTPLRPEIHAPPFTYEDYERGLVPEDGEIIRDRTYEEVKAFWTRPGPRGVQER